jgi:hypothetical protein
VSLAPPAAPRKPLHLRRISCEGFLREDGLIDIEGLLIDTKPLPVQLVNKSLAAGEPIHQMRVRLTIDRERCIVDAQAWSEHTPYPDCMEVEAGYRKLIGMRIEPGFTLAVKRLFRGTLGCSHMTELLPPMASTAFQTMWADGDFKTVDPQGSKQRTSPLGGCHALRLNGHIVKTYFPQQYKETAP